MDEKIQTHRILGGFLKIYMGSLKDGTGIILDSKCYRISMLRGPHLDSDGITIG